MKRYTHLAYATADYNKRDEYGSEQEVNSQLRFFNTCTWDCPTGYPSSWTQRNVSEGFERQTMTRLCWNWYRLITVIVRGLSLVVSGFPIWPPGGSCILTTCTLITTMYLLDEGDCFPRLPFASCFFQMRTNNPQFPVTISFSDQMIYTREGMFNSHNTHCSRRRNHIQQETDQPRNAFQYMSWSAS